MRVRPARGWRRRCVASPRSGGSRRLATLSRRRWRWARCSRRGLPPVDMTPVIFVALSALSLARRRQRRRRGRAARLGYVFGFGYFTAGLYWIAVGAVRRYRAFLVGAAVRGVRHAGVLSAFVALGTYAAGLARFRLGTTGLCACLRLRGDLGDRRMAARPRLYRLSVESCRLCLGGRVSRRAGDAADRRLDRHLRAEPRHGSRRLPAGAARRRR